MSCATFKATTENPPMAPFAKGGGPKDRGIFASNRHFHKRRKDAKGREKCHFDRREKSLLDPSPGLGMTGFARHLASLRSFDFAQDMLCGRNLRIRYLYLPGGK
jgi:hypothetical protein